MLSLEGRSVARAPHSCRADLLRRRSGGVVRLSCCYRTTVRSIVRAPHYRCSYMRARRVPCVRARRFLGASEARPLAREQGLISCTRTMNLEGRSVFRVPHYVALLSVRRVDVRTLPCRHRVDGRGSRVDGRRSMVDGRWLRVAVPSLGRHAIVTRNVCYVDVRAV